MKSESKLSVRVTSIQLVADRIKEFHLASATQDPLPRFSPGSHIIVTMKADNNTYRNSYSLMGLLDEPGYRISVLHTESSRGGSRFMHEEVRVNSILTVNYPLNLFPIVMPARKHLLVAGGIGITPFLSMLEQLNKMGAHFELHYLIRNHHRGAYVDQLKAHYGTYLHLYRTELGERPVVDSLLQKQPLGTHIYVCGPESLIQSVTQTAQKTGWPDTNIHSERFYVPVGGDAFSIKLARSRQIIQVGEHETPLEAIEAAGVEAPCLCRGGACGQCEVRVLSSSGALVHNDHVLSALEREAGEKFMICVSRAKGGTLVLDL